MIFEKRCEQRLRRIVSGMPKETVRKWLRGRKEHRQSLLGLDCLNEIDHEIYDIIGYMAIHREQIKFYLDEQREYVGALRIKNKLLMDEVKELKGQVEKLIKKLEVAQGKEYNTLKGWWSKCCSKWRMISRRG
jgi:predicted RNase H-like nuclease (RuvC/YqgF family)